MMTFKTRNDAMNHFNAYFFTPAIAATAYKTALKFRGVTADNCAADAELEKLVKNTAFAMAFNDWLWEHAFDIEIIQLW